MIRTCFTSIRISIHAPREGGDRSASLALSVSKEFQSTPPARGATYKYRYHIFTISFQSTPPARGATLVYFLQAPIQGISIHAPREGGDRMTTPLILKRLDFNPRPPRGGRPPCQGTQTETHHFNPRPPRGGRRTFEAYIPQSMTISIHAPREGGDFLRETHDLLELKFQSTPPARGATLPSHLPLSWLS